MLPWHQRTKTRPPQDITDTVVTESLTPPFVNPTNIENRYPNPPPITGKTTRYIKYAFNELNFIYPPVYWQPHCLLASMYGMLLTVLPIASTADVVPLIISGRGMP